MTNGHAENINGREVQWFVGYGDESTGWYVEELRAGGVVRILSGYRSRDEAVEDARGYYDHQRMSVR